MCERSAEYASAGRSRDGLLFADFDREAASQAEAITSTIQQIESAGIGLTVIRVEPDELVSSSEIASRSDLVLGNAMFRFTGLRAFVACGEHIVKHRRAYRFPDLVGVKQVAVRGQSLQARKEHAFAGARRPGDDVLETSRADHKAHDPARPRT